MVTDFTDLKLSPLFPDFENGGRLLQYCPAELIKYPVDPVKSLSLQILTIKPEQGRSMDSIAACEDHLLGEAKLMSLDYWDFPRELRRQSAYLAQRCRRGWPSGVLMNKSLAIRLSLHGEHAAFEDRSLGQSVGRWTPVGSIHKAGTIWLTEDFPHDEAVLFYNNTKWIGDAAAVILDTDDGLRMIRQNDVGHDAEPNRVMSYITRIRFTEDQEKNQFGILV